MISRSIIGALASLAAAAFLLVGCSAADGPGAPAPTGTTSVVSPSLSARDTAALTQLRRAASSSAEADGAGTAQSVDCWIPSQHLVGGQAPAGVFSVLCRVHYEEGTTARYKDMTCIGDFAKDPMLTRCYRWAYYSAEPRFEDGPRLASPPPTPFPEPSPAAG